MKAILTRRLKLFSIILIVGALVAGSIVVLGAEKLIPGATKEYISIVKPSTTAQTPGQVSERHARFEARLKDILGIAQNDGRVQGLIAGKNYTVVGIAIEKIVPSVGQSDTGPALPDIRNAPPPPRHGDIGHALLVIKAEGKFYKIVIDVPHQQVISVEERLCYGPWCND